MTANFMASGEPLAPSPAPNEPETFINLNDCGHNVTGSETYAFGDFRVFSKSENRIDIIGLKVQFRIVNADALETGYPSILQSFTKTALANAFGGIETSEISTTNL